MLEEKAVLFVTNNATKSRVNYKKKFDTLGVEAHVVSPPLPLPCRATFVPAPPPRRAGRGSGATSGEGKDAKAAGAG